MVIKCGCTNQYGTALKHQKWYGSSHWLRAHCLMGTSYPNNVSDTCSYSWNMIAPPFAGRVSYANMASRGDSLCPLFHAVYSSINDENIVVIGDHSKGSARPPRCLARNISTRAIKSMRFAAQNSYDPAALSGLRPCNATLKELGRPPTHWKGQHEIPWCCNHNRDAQLIVTQQNQRLLLLALHSPWDWCHRRGTLPAPAPERCCSV